MRVSARVNIALLRDRTRVKQHIAFGIHRGCYHAGHPLYLGHFAVTRFSVSDFGCLKTSLRKTIESPMPRKRPYICPHLRRKRRFDRALTKAAAARMQAQYESLKAASGFK